MGSAKISITLDPELLRQVDRYLTDAKYANRSQLIRVAIREKLKHRRTRRLARESAKLNPREERSLADEGFGT